MTAEKPTEMYFRVNEAVNRKLPRPVDVLEVDFSGR